MKKGRKRMMLIYKKIEEGSREKTYRNELKYVCSEGELIQIKKRIEPFCRLDPHVGQDGIYRIRRCNKNCQINLRIILMINMTGVFMKMKMEQIPEKNFVSEYIMRIFPISFWNVKEKKKVWHINIIL